jgi:hypothetical protein
MSIECKICGGTRIILKENIRTVCTCLYKDKLDKRIREVFGFYSIDQMLINQIRDINSDQNIFLQCKFKDQALLNGVLSYLWTMAGGRSIDRSISIFNVYEIFHIYLNQYDTYKSIYDITSDIVILLDGFEEYNNKGLYPIVMQFLEDRRRHNNITWFVTISNNMDSKLSNYLSNTKYHDVILTIDKININKDKTYFGL